jgi:hypothetical protein
LRWLACAVCNNCAFRDCHGWDGFGQQRRMEKARSRPVARGGLTAHRTSLHTPRRAPVALSWAKRRDSARGSGRNWWPKRRLSGGGLRPPPPPPPPPPPQRWRGGDGCRSSSSIARCWLGRVTFPSPQRWFACSRGAWRRGRCVHGWALGACVCMMMQQLSSWPGTWLLHVGSPLVSPSCAAVNNVAVATAAAGGFHGVRQRTTGATQVSRGKQVPRAAEEGWCLRRFRCRLPQTARNVACHSTPGGCRGGHQIYRAI